MTLTTLAWLSMAAYSVHILEEYAFDWRNWARQVIGLPVEWSDFYVTNAVVVALGIAQAELASALPLAPLSFSALMLINAALFHVAPFIREKGRFSPGLLTAVALFVPLGITTFALAVSTGQADAGTVIASFVIGGLIMAFPIVMLNVKSKPYFIQQRAR
jgi:hypothetical protein